MKLGEDTIWRLVFLAVPSALLLALCPIFFSTYIISTIALVVMNISLCHAWNLVSGMAGYMSFGHHAYLGLGAYTTAILITKYNANIIPSALFGGVVAAIICVPIGYITFNLKSHYFSLVSLCLAEALRIIFINMEWTGGSIGISISTGYNLYPFYYSMIFLGFSSTLMMLLIQKSRLGTRLHCIRDDEIAAETLGVNTRRVKLTTLVISAFITGIIGGFLGWYITYINPSAVFNINKQVEIMIITLLGGIGTIAGPIIGALVFVVISDLLWARFPDHFLIILGVLILIIIRFIPRGIYPRLLSLRRKLRSTDRSIPQPHQNEKS